MLGMTINPGAAEFPHRQIAAQIRERIWRGDWAPGEKVPSIPSMAASYGVAKQTVQRTFDQLRIEGLLITRPGSGTFVRGTRRKMNRLSRGRYGAQRGYHAELAARYRQKLMQVGTAVAPPEVAEAFGLDAGAVLLVRRHLVSTGDAPVEIGASWFKPADVRGTTIEHAEVFGRPLYQEVEDETSRRYASARDQVTARLPTRDEAEVLQIRPDTPVLSLLHVAFDEEHRPLEVAQAVWPGPMTALTEEYQIPAARPGLPTDEPDIALG
jgi:GntR family transcriptional regulator